jgi:NAD(P)-dependent dehydrogenase (short-subunit alcohol dehydrogenase family)
MDLQLQGKHVLITGGSRGIGLACAREFLREGCRVSIVGRDAQRMEQARATLGAGVAGFCADLRDAQAWRDAMDSKFFTTINVLDPVVRRMGARGAGSVVNVVGMGGKVATPTHLPGGSANAALMLASAGLAAAWGGKGVRVNAVNPTLTLTDRLAEGFAADARLRGSSLEEVRRAAEAKMPLGRLAQPEEIAAAVLFLASPRASYISGAILSLDGAATPMVV